MERNERRIFMLEKELVIIGGGSAGLAAAIQAKEDGIDDILILEKENCLGGILQQCIHNGFGLETFKEQLSGPEYAQRYIDILHDKQIAYKLETTVLKITKEKDVYYANQVDGYVHLKAKAIILATGCSERSAGAIQLEGDRVSGIMTAGLAQRYLNIDGYLVGKRVFILGSGDIGLIMARRLTLEGAEVLGVAEIMPYSNGLNRNIVQCLNDFHIPLYLSHTVKKVIGKNRVEKIILTQVDENLNAIANTEKEFICDTLILSVGLVPYNPLVENIVQMNSTTKGAIVNSSLQTSISGIFSCGNALHVHDLVDFVSLEAKSAGHYAACYLKQQLKKGNVYPILNGEGIRYVLPTMYDLENMDETLEIKFRVKKPYGKCKILISENGQILKQMFRPYLLPAEMVLIRLNKEIFLQVKSGITIAIKEE